MTTDPIDANPYRSPMANGRAIEPIVWQSPPRRFRWRVIPVALLYLYGGSMIVSPLLCLSMLLWLAVFVGDRLAASWNRGDLPPVLFGSLVAIPVAIPLGCLFCYAGRNLWLGRWRRGSITALMGVAIFGGAVAVFQLLR